MRKQKYLCKQALITITKRNNKKKKIKENNNKKFVILDAGMNDLMRPALYGAKHKILPVKKNKLKSFTGHVHIQTHQIYQSSK